MAPFVLSLLLYDRPRVLGGLKERFDSGLSPRRCQHSRLRAAIRALNFARPAATVPGRPRSLPRALSRFALPLRAMSTTAADAPRPAKRARGADDDQRAFRVAVRGRDFTLSREQVLAEGADTFLALALLGDWREGPSDCRAALANPNRPRALR